MQQKPYHSQKKFFKREKEGYLYALKNLSAYV